MNLQERKSAFIKQFMTIDDEQLIETLWNVMDIAFSKDKRINLEQYNQELEASDQEVDKGQFSTNKALRKEIKNW